MHPQVWEPLLQTRHSDTKRNLSSHVALNPLHISKAIAKPDQPFSWYVLQTWLLSLFSFWNAISPILYTSKSFKVWLRNYFLRKSFLIPYVPTNSLRGGLCCAGSQQTFLDEVKWLTIWLWVSEGDGDRRDGSSSNLERRTHDSYS